MKLINMLVVNGLNGWQWPDGVEAITQDSDKAINKYKTANGLEINEYGTWKFSLAWQGYLLRSGDANLLATDYATAIITREQYEAALAAKNDDWIEWGGGECPVEKGTLVDVKYRDGVINKGLRALIENSGRSASRLFWVKDNTSNDIIAYRLHKPQEAEQAEADDEADLNECIGQDAAPVWNGDGAIPPVGCVCESSWAGDEWQQCKILFASNQIVVVKLKESGMEDAYNIGDVTFRPIRSEADRKRDEAVVELSSVIDYRNGCSSKPLAGWLYDAIAAGKIPGVKLDD